MESTPVIELQGVSYKYGDRYAVSDINLTVREGEFLGIIGANGAGKSTTLKLMIGLLRPTHGKVSLFGQPLSHFRDWNKIGYISQKASSFNTQFPATVREVVETGLVGQKGIWWFKRADNNRKVLEALDLVGMLDYKDRRIGELSGGQQQRVFIARAIVKDPRLLLLDEPVEGVDVEAQAQFYELLEKLNKEHGLTLVMVSHDIGTISKKVGTLACINTTLHYHGEPEAFLEGDLSNAYGHDVQLVHHHHS